MRGEFEPVGVGVHQDQAPLIADRLRLGGVQVVDEATTSGHPAVYFTLTGDDGQEFLTYMSLKQFLLTMKLVMDGYPEYVREVYGI